LECCGHRIRAKGNSRYNKSRKKKLTNLINLCCKSSKNVW